MTYEDAVDDWKSNDDWQFADKEACWKFMFEKGQESLRQQLAAALAAIKVKDEALEKACTRIEEYGFEIGEHWNTGRKSLAIRPDDSALKAWLGEPVARTLKRIGEEQYQPESGLVARTYAELPKDSYPDTWQELDELYSPKGLK